jgi:hypothetical protein
VRRSAAFVAAGLVVAAALAFGVSRWASSQPDGLEKVAADRGLDADVTDHPLADGPLADYETDGVGDPGLSTGGAGLIGVVVVFVVAGGLVWVGRSVGRRTDAADPSRGTPVAVDR